MELGGIKCMAGFEKKIAFVNQSTFVSENVRDDPIATMDNYQESIRV